MARVHEAVARKDYPQAGIKKGETYYYWTPYRAGRHMSKTRSTPSQVESNPTRASYLALQEGLENDIDGAESVEDLKGILEAAAEEATSVVDKLREKAQNIEDGFQHSTEQSDSFNSQADEVESWAEDLGNAVDDNAEEPGAEPVLPDRSSPAFGEGEKGDKAFEEAPAEYEKEREAYDEAVQEWENALDEARSAAHDAVGQAPEI